MDMQVTDFITDLMKNGALIITATFILGAIIKSSLSFIPNKYIPIICTLFGGILTIITGQFKDPIAIQFIKGCILGWASTGAYETYRNLKSNKKA